VEALRKNGDIGADRLVKRLAGAKAAPLAKRGDVTVTYDREDPMNAKLYPLRYFEVAGKPK
jgi:hypothetical protein